MTIHTTPNYGIAYCDVDTAAIDLATASQQAAQTIDAALGRGGIAPPDATTQAQLAARIATLEPQVALESERRWRRFRQQWNAAALSVAAATDTTVYGLGTQVFDAGVVGGTNAADAMGFPVGSSGAAAVPTIRKSGRYRLRCTLPMTGGTAGAACVFRLSRTTAVAGAILSTSLPTVPNEMYPTIDGEANMTAGDRVYPLLWVAAGATTVQPVLGGITPFLQLDYLGPVPTNPTTRP